MLSASEVEAVLTELQLQLAPLEEEIDRYHREEPNGVMEQITIKQHEWYQRLIYLCKTCLMAQARVAELGAALARCPCLAQFDIGSPYHLMPIPCGECATCLARKERDESFLAYCRFSGSVPRAEGTGREKKGARRC